MQTQTLNTAPHYAALLLSSVPSALITVALILLMFNLIATEVPEIVEGGITIGPVVMDPPEKEETITEERTTKPDEPAPPPEWTSPSEAVDPGESLVALAPTDPTGFELADIDPNASGGGIVAYLKPQPMYPNRAITRGLEGFVDLAFDITPSGATTNIRVITAEPKGIFERAAIRALQKWKYKVPVVDGIATGQRDMMTRMTFNLDQG